ncbi:MAG TPA: hypothetical protein VIV12_01145, partial [Streptosporangiaceae bacterium]
MRNPPSTSASPGPSQPPGPAPRQRCPGAENPPPEANSARGAECPRGRPNNSTVVVAGLGYVGLPLAMRAVAAGHRVIGYDTDTGRVKRLAAG